MYLTDTNVIGVGRKNEKANPGVTGFLRDCAANGGALYLSSISVGELRRRVESMQHRGDLQQAALRHAWLEQVLDHYCEDIVVFDSDAAQVWGRVRVLYTEHERDKQIAAIPS